jgi:octaprenyl-diphosphate synthase
MNFSETIRRPILDEMQLFDKTFAVALSTENPLLSSINEYVLQKSGKQLRPMLAVLSAKICGDLNESTIFAALSLELLHTASLIHDDVVDDTLERRGSPSVNSRWTNKIAVLSGDYMLSKSLSCANQTNSLEILRLISNIGMELADGELLQLDNVKASQISVESYLNIIRKKTAFLFSTCTEVGAVSVNASEAELKALRYFGECLGICFQIKDDIFDYQDDIQIGKPTGNDIRDGKVTLPLIYALQNSKLVEKEQIMDWIDNKEFSAENIQAITRFTHDHNGIKQAISKMEHYKNMAIEALNVFVDSEIKKSLVLCAEYAASREK